MAAQPTILVAGDRWGEREAMVEQFSSRGFRSAVCEDIRDIPRVSGEASLLVIQLDSWESGIYEAIEGLRRREPPIPVIIVATHDEVVTAATDIGLGEVEFLIEPVSAEKLVGAVWRAVERFSRAGGGGQSVVGARHIDQLPLVAVSETMRRVVEQVRRAAESESPVLLSGEQGTGKKLIARRIHFESRRQSGPFVSVNLATLAAAAVEPRLFGAGGENGNGSLRTGELRAAGGGTLLIEEITHLPRTAQARLLSALEKRYVAPLESGREESSEARLIVSTTRDIDELVSQERFRADLYYHLNVVPIHVPALRQRREDIPPLVRRFLAEICTAESVPPLEPDAELMRLLEDYDWPGNIRQLRDSLRSIVNLARRQPVLASGYARGYRIADAAGTRQEKRLAELEKMAMVEALEQHGGNRTSAAQALGISVRTLQRKLKKWTAERETARE